MLEVRTKSAQPQNNGAQINNVVRVIKAIRVTTAVSRRSAVVAGALGIGSMILAPQAFAADKPKCIA
ncbi:hypothetical protein B0H03_10451 [Rathayibacter iranicus NCPPB 2253 = VKM Ac-1602]|uniref:Uncharacterized protein n=1 Tax=Rathayibacter iranicus NCPPB 2253 = VKM Ac-1602 TaxID=1328868 RepID=A0ABX5LGA9_9MICO|nr:hypothetical protein B0H03_10451 [Rathayibacter iranicus NCPPB 2253 = VKM Ac-1602]